ncbi:tellurite resistance/C4-dicarboxylate transporter family protein [Actinomadura gamaensis]|uniref:Tellurite resistance/C4-dicarboxylate transporter family protein n=1 Tax=Actinomadura gamaensis TaxID=1763541 RepID=A0ABV9TSS6_9ACTN
MKRRQDAGDPAPGVGPAFGAAVMATGIVSVGLHLVGAEALSVALLVVAALLWVPLCALFAARLLRAPARWRDESATPAALTGVAGTGVLGVRLTAAGATWAGAVLLAAAFVLWAVLLPTVLEHLRGRVPGAAYLVCVSTQSLAVLAGTVAPPLHAAWLMWPALAAAAVGVLLWLLVVARFDWRQLRAGRGDHWVAGGSVSISALAAAKLVAASARPLDWAPGLHGALRGAALALVLFALAWYAVLVACEIRWPRFAYDVRRWSTVFPLGMTSVAALTCGTALRISWLSTAGRVLLWPAVIVWGVVAVGAVRAQVRANRRAGDG